jgi:CheY-like chemotaxis protein
MRVLVIEDDAIIGADLELCAADLGFKEVLAARDEAGAVAVAESSHPNLIICDLRLGPEGSGVRAANAILRQGPAAIVFVTGLLPGNELVVDKAGVVTLGKPCDVIGLKRAINRAVTRPAGSRVQVEIS